MPTLRKDSTFAMLISAHDVPIYGTMFLYSARYGMGFAPARLAHITVEPVEPALGLTPAA
jgi:hypothetical protein